jgi:hypothetical protein
MKLKPAPTIAANANSIAPKATILRLLTGAQTLPEINTD